MKTQKNNYLKNSVALLVLFFIALSANGQKINCAEVPETDSNEPSSLLMEIKENDFEYFLNVMSLKKYSNIIYDGLVVECYKDRNYRLTSNGKNLKLEATYGEDGSLIKGKLIKKDTYLPVNIRKHLSGYMAQRWGMVSNKMFVHDFDPLKTEYEVKFQRDDKTQTVFFDHSGKRIKGLSGS